MQTKKILEVIRNYLTTNRRVGHTSAMMRGAENVDNVLVLAANHQQSKMLQQNLPHAEVVSITSGACLTGKTKPIVMDNETIWQICDRALKEIERLETLLAELPQKNQQTTIPQEILAIGERLRTQDNLGTQDPLFCVQVLDRIGPIDVSDSEKFYFYDSDHCAAIYEDGADPNEFRRFEVLEDHDLLPDHITKHGYKEQWLTVTTCLTHDAATDFIAATQHRYGAFFGVRVYVDSLYRNEEMLLLCQFLKNLGAIKNS